MNLNLAFFILLILIGILIKIKKPNYKDPIYDRPLTGKNRLTLKEIFDFETRGAKKILIPFWIIVIISIPILVFISIHN